MIARNRTARQWLLIPLVIGAWSALSCDEEGNPIIQPGTLVTITLRNQDALPAHLFLDSEDFPCCQVAAGSSRNAQLETVGNGWTR